MFAVSRVEDMGALQSFDINISQVLSKLIVNGLLILGRRPIEKCHFDKDQFGTIHMPVG